MVNKDKTRAIRLLLIAMIYNMIIASIGYSIDWFNDNFWHFDWTRWGLVEWWFVGSIIVTIGGIMLYLAPYFEEWLYAKLDKKIININKKDEKNEG
jgi:hypothetical protein